ncbi:WD40 repeat-like protein, partial [Lichtheimia hyalospora FSU 10163]
MTCKRSTTTSTTALSSKSTIANDGSFTYGQYKTHTNIQTSIQNWQLRNLISFSDHHTILHPYYEALNFYNPALGTETSLPLPFAPTTVDSKCGYVAVGGHRGATMVKSLSDEWSSTLKVGMGMNNCIQLSGHDNNNECRLTICNNDQTMSVYSIPDLKNLVTLDLSSAAINQISTSPDGRSLLTVSDDGNVSLFNTRDYTKTTSFQVGHGGGPALACAWNDSSNLIAVSSHEGAVHVYDVRQYDHALAKIGSTEARSTRNAPRSIRFSHSPLDLLVYAEHVSNINIVDTRTFEVRQVIRLGSHDSDTHIAGIELSPDHRSIYAGLETDMVQIDIDTAARRQFPSARLF